MKHWLRTLSFVILIFCISTIISQAQSRIVYTYTWENDSGSVILENDSILYYYHVSDIKYKTNCTYLYKVKRNRIYIIRAQNEKCILNRTKLYLKDKRNKLVFKKVQKPIALTMNSRKKDHIYLQLKYYWCLIFNRKNITIEKVYIKSGPTK